MALAAGAKNYGAEFYQHAPVSATNQKSDGTWEVVTPQGTIHANRVINAAGEELSSLISNFKPEKAYVFMLLKKGCSECVDRETWKK